MRFNKNTNDKPSQARSSTKRPRAPIACYRCHHKKVRCDGTHPNCTRCLSTGVLCAYPSSRRSPKITRIESDLESQRELVRSICGKPNDALNTNILQTEKNPQDPCSIVTQLRIHGDKQTKSGAISSNKNPMEPTTNNYHFIDNSLTPYNNSGGNIINNNSFQDWMMMNTERNLFDESFFYQNILTPFLPDKNQPVLTSEIYNEPYLT
ncbi:unnamed protein product [Rhizopus stolonifer]